MSSPKIKIEYSVQNQVCGGTQRCLPEGVIARTHCSLYGRCDCNTPGYQQCLPHLSRHLPSQPSNIDQLTLGLDMCCWCPVIFQTTRPIPYSSTPSLHGTKWQLPTLNSLARSARLKLGSFAGSSITMPLPERPAVAAGPRPLASIFHAADSEVYDLSSPRAALRARTRSGVT